VLGETLKLPIYQVDAFTDKHFSGNPARVCLLNKTLEKKLIQKIANEIRGVIVTSKSKEYENNGLTRQIKFYPFYDIDSIYP